MTHETASMLILSTGHITFETSQRLDNTALADWPCAGGPYGDMGYFVYAHDDNLEPLIPDDLWAVMVKARELGCAYILLDRDGDYVDGLLIYNW